MSRTRKPSPASPLDARIARIRAVWELMGATAPESRETFLAKLDEIGRAWTGYCWQPEYLRGHAKAAVELDLDGAVWAVTLAMNGGQPPSAVARAALRAAVAHLAPGGELTAEGTGPLLDERCRAGECGPCPGAPCECRCHTNAKENGDAR